MRIKDKIELLKEPIQQFQYDGKPESVTILQKAIIELRDYGSAVCHRFQLKEANNQVSSIFDSCLSKLATIEPGAAEEEINWKISYVQQYTGSALKLLDYFLKSPEQDLTAQEA